ncbi:hypothetical protein G6O69_30700 [Pseudenhygromyxa sp. WMMC2535]|uniref:hypothetical protein n=1 Tax=Pseudenhygromyxa sp. WMMC2535 TaxID=2712867 RepID=UPI00155173CF|nr:hypothetical protein [Pseudenhygromyxa sp. WMMC2535]NVB42233.1 hypothetical protein [Pseudenhygromyxa sp. WMMC2535]
MPLASTLALASALALAPGRGEAASADSGQRTLERCSTDGHDLFVGYGPRTAPTLLRLYVDPSTGNQLQSWLEARRIAGERKDSLRIELVVTRGGLAEDDAADPVRLWFMAVAALGEAEDGLRMLEGRDWQRVAVQLRSAEGRAALAQTLDLDPEHIEARRTGAAGACLLRRLDHESQHMAALTMGQPNMIVGIVDAEGNESIQPVDAQLSDLRGQLERARKTSPSADEAMISVPYGPTLGGQASRLDRTFPSTGVLVGGRALAHRLVIFIEDEDSGKLPSWLGPAMRYRAQNPGELSVQVIAAGVGTRAIRLRRRLCAARTLGLEVEFLMHLAERPAVRRLHQQDLDEVIQPVADSDACSDSEVLDPGPSAGTDTRRGTDFGHPRGAWLDGRPVNRGELEGLEWQLSSSAQPSLVDWLSQPDTLMTPFEF